MNFVKLSLGYVLQTRQLLLRTKDKVTKKNVNNVPKGVTDHFNYVLYWKQKHCYSVPKDM